MQVNNIAFSTKTNQCQKVYLTFYNFLLKSNIRNERYMNSINHNKSHLMSMPKMDAVPPVGAVIPVRMLNRVVFPAPL